MSADLNNYKGVIPQMRALQLVTENMFRVHSPFPYYFFPFMKCFYYEIMRESLPKGSSKVTWDPIFPLHCKVGKVSPLCFIGTF